VYLVRVNLEGMARRLAYENMTPERLRKLQCEPDGMEEGARIRDSRVYMQHHDAYHDTFIQQSENRILIEILEKLRRQTNWHRFYFSYHDSHFAAALNSHRHIQETFGTVGLAGDEVEGIVRMHILEGFKQFRQHVQKTCDADASQPQKGSATPAVM
jgi:DNA-binding GntR family transcriptional regulator